MMSLEEVSVVDITAFADQLHFDLMVEASFHIVVDLAVVANPTVAASTVVTESVTQFVVVVVVPEMEAN